MILNNKNTNNGFTIIEVVVSLLVITSIMTIATLLFRDTFVLQRFISSGLQSQFEAKRILRPFANEVRGASPSSTGTYPIAMASSTSFIFYSDIDSDGLKERIRYFMDGNNFKKGVIKPSGSPVSYTAAEQIVEIVHNVISTTTPVFVYYGEEYDGVATTSPLSQPVSPNDVRLIKVTLVVDDDPNSPPAPIVLTTQVSFRNLKDNL